MYVGPDIVQDGLVFAVDAGSERSYPGSGTTATSLVSSNTGTLTNGVGFGSGNGGHWYFDGVDDGIKFISELDLSSYSSVTYSGWIKGLGVTSLDRWLSGTSGATAFHNPDLTVSAAGLLSYYFTGITSSWTSTGISISGTEYNYVVFTFTNSGSVELYVNGSSVYTASLSSTTFPSVSNIMIGNRYDLNGEALLGDIAAVRIYNRALSAAEVLQNFNAQRTRFL
tara:strand:+ start:539 stop:1213 length:675 start_codon:yes stop_codon:yes gene_type:complete